MRKWFDTIHRTKILHFFMQNENIIRMHMKNQHRNNEHEFEKRKQNGRRNKVFVVVTLFSFLVLCTKRIVNTI